MAKRHKRDIIYSTDGTFLQYEHINSLTIFFKTTIKACKQAEVSELINLNNYKIKRDINNIKSMLITKKDKPFVFISCLN